MAGDVSANALTYFIGPQAMEKVINKVKSILRQDAMSFFGNQLKKLIPAECRSLMCINVTIYKGKNPILRILVEQLKILAKNLSKLINILIDLLLGLFSSNKLDSILKAVKDNIFNILESGLKDHLNCLVDGILFKEFNKRKNGKKEL